jgi:PAS domain S-box-containing protein
MTEHQDSQDSLEKLSSVVEQAADNVFITDRAGVIEHVNAAFEQLTGYSRNEAIGQTPRLLKSGRHDEAFYHTLWQTILAAAPEWLAAPGN